MKAQTSSMLVYVLGYPPGTITGPRPTSAVTHMPPDETIRHR
jgi:hypothetical protein